MKGLTKLISQALMLMQLQKMLLK